MQLQRGKRDRFIFSCSCKSAHFQRFDARPIVKNKSVTLSLKVTLYLSHNYKPVISACFFNRPYRENTRALRRVAPHPLLSLRGRGVSGRGRGAASPLHPPAPEGSLALAPRADSPDSPAGAVPNSRAMSCISSMASRMRSNGNRAQRRSCSRRAPSKLVSRQSKSGVGDSFSGIVFQPHAQVFDVYPVLFPARRCLHLDQRGDADKPHFDGPIQGFDQRVGILLIKGKGLMDE